MSPHLLSFFSQLVCYTIVQGNFVVVPVNNTEVPKTKLRIRILFKLYAGRLIKSEPLRYDTSNLAQSPSPLFKLYNPHILTLVVFFFTF